MWNVTGLLYYGPDSFGNPSEHMNRGSHLRPVSTPSWDEETYTLASLAYFCFEVDARQCNPLSSSIAFIVEGVCLRVLQLIASYFYIRATGT